LIDTASEIIAESQHKNLNPLKRQRMSARLTQLELAQKSGVKLRMIQAYEQNYQDITKAEVGTMLRLARTLSCNIEDLLT
jgi:transcriptional regulator with XRE-family HTH domain